MAYKALYRTYRPQLFREVVGQDVIVKTLQNAIANNKISHAYLLSGPRGTGKTTIARIFAKTLNCENIEMLEPCNKCVSCHEISDSISPDVIEIDAASNNGVDEIRDIREKVKFLPVGAKYKIYIIDEVHMLSPGAFNALLKTLEEPPKHVIFILATTEPQKLPATIISRCQRFDFKSLSVGEIAKKLRVVCGEEDIEITEEAINAISEAAEGGLRDALSILDQAISYSDQQVTIEDVNVVTGNLSYNRIIELADYFEHGNINNALEVINELIDMGKEVSKLVSSLLQFYRDMLLYKNIDSVIYSKYIFEKEPFKELAKNISVDKIFYYIEVLSDVQVKIKYSPTPRIYLEIAIIKMINVSSDELNYVKRIEEVESKLDNINFTKNNSEGNNEKVNVLEMKINQIISELNKLELNKLAQKVDEITIKVNTNNPAPVKNDDLYRKLNELQENIVLLKTSYNNVINQVENIVPENGEKNIDLMQRINQLEQKINNRDLKCVQDDVDALKLSITNLSNIQYDNTTNNYSELVNKVNNLERKLYEIVSGELANKGQLTPKKTKKAAQQIVLFADDLTPIEEFKNSNPANVNFKDLTKENITEKDDPQVVVEVKQDQPKLSLKNEKKIDQPEVINREEQKDQPEDIYREEKQEQSEIIINEKIEEPKVKNREEKLDVITEVQDKPVEKNKNVFAAEKQLLEKEMLNHPTIKVTSRSNVNEDIKEIKVNNQITENEIDRYMSYDIKIIEGILHESRTEPARNDMNRIKQLWNNLEVGVDPDYMGTAETLKDGTIAAVGNKEFILVFKTSTLCNQVMRPSFKNKALKFLFNCLGDTYNYMALPENTWIEKRKEYVNQYNIGIKYPKLTPINDPTLIIMKNDEYKDPKEKVIKKTIDSYGDLVNVE